MCPIFRTIPWVLCKVQLIYFERVKIESHKKWNLGSWKSTFQWGNFNFICHAEQWKSHFVIRNAWNSRWVRLQTQWRPWHKTFINGPVSCVCLWLGPLGVFFSPDCLWVASTFLCFITICLQNWPFHSDDTLDKQEKPPIGNTFF